MATQPPSKAEQHATMMERTSDRDWRVVGSAASHRPHIADACQLTLLSQDGAPRSATLSRTEAAVAQVIGKVARGYVVAAGYAQERRISALEDELKTLRHQFEAIGRVSDSEGAWVSVIAKSYVPLAADIDGVVAVFLNTQGGGCDITTVVAQLNGDAEEALYAAEYQAMASFPKGPFDFQIVDEESWGSANPPVGSICVFPA